MNPNILQQAIELLSQAAKEQKPRLRLRELWHRFAASHQVSAITMTAYEGFWRLHLDRLLGELHLDEISMDVVERYRETRKGELCRLTGEETKAGTRNREVSLLKTMISWAVARGLVSHSQIANTPKEPEHNVRETVLSEEQLARVAEHLDDLVLAYVLIIFDGGLRRKEACAVRWDQLDAEAGTLRVSWRDAKLQRARTTILSSRAWDAVSRLPRTSPHVFVNPDTGRPFTPNYFLVKWRRACRIAGIYGPDGNVTLHDLRRSFCTAARRRDIPETAIMQLTGHKSHDVFVRYSIVGTSDIANARERMESGLAADLEALRRGHRFGPHRAQVCDTSKTLDDPSSIERDSAGRCYSQSTSHSSDAPGAASPMGRMDLHRQVRP